MQDSKRVSSSGSSTSGVRRLFAAKNMRQHGSVSQTDVVDALVSLGFNLNEGRAYTALLKLGPSTGYEVSQRSGVPRSAVYAVVRKLVDEGAARSLAGTPEHFVATPPEALLLMLRQRLQSSEKAFKSAVAQLHVAEPPPGAFSVRGYERVMEEASRIVGSAKQCLVLSGWPRELELLSGELRGAQKRGVYVVIFSHAALAPSLAGIHFSYSLPSAELEQFWNHRLALVADDERSLIGATERDEGDTAVLSEAPAIAEFAVGQIALDITLLAQRYCHDVSAVMARILGDRVGKLDRLLGPELAPELGVAWPSEGKSKSRAKKKSSPSR